MFNQIFQFYTKYFTKSVIVFSIFVVILGLLYLDLDQMYYAKCNESLIQLWGDSPANFLDLSQLNLSILLVLCGLVFLLTLSWFFDTLKNPVLLFVSSFLIKTWILVYTSGSVILNLGFIKIFKGMTEIEKQAFIDSLKDNMLKSFEELPLEIQKIMDPSSFKATTLNYITSLKNVIPTEPVATVDLFSTFGNYLWDNKISIVLGILNILVLAALNSKIENTAAKLDAYTTKNDENMILVESTLKSSSECIEQHEQSIQLLNENDSKLNDSVEKLATLFGFNEQSSLEFDNMSEFYLLNWFILIFKKLLLNKKK